MVTHHRRARPAARTRRASRGSRHGSRTAAVPTAVGDAADWASVIGAGDSHTSVGPDGSEAAAASAGSDTVDGPADSSDALEATRSTDLGDAVDLIEDLGCAARRASGRPREPGPMNPAWTRLVFAGVVPLPLAVGSVLPGWVGLALAAVLAPAATQD